MCLLCEELWMPFELPPEAKARAFVADSPEPAEQAKELNGSESSSQPKSPPTPDPSPPRFAWGEGNREAGE